MVPFPSSNGNKYILVAIDYVFKWVEAQAFPASDARNVVNFLKRLFTRFGIPKALISGRGTHFCNYQMERAMKRHTVETYRITSPSQLSSLILPVIIDYKLHKEGMLVHYQLIRADGSSKRYSSMIRMLQGIDREDLEALWRIVKAKYGDTRPDNEFERVLWGDLKVMFEPDKRSDVWRILQGYRVTIWKLIDSSGVHFVRRNLKIQKMNIKFRGGLLGLKRLHGFLEVTAAQSKTRLGYDAATAASPIVESFVNLTGKSGSDKGYHSVPPPLTRNIIPHKPDLTLMDEIVKSENLDVTTVVTPCNVKSDENKGVSNIVESNAVRMKNTSSPIIEDWNYDDERERDYTIKPSTEKIKFVKTVREIEAPKKIPRGNQRNWNNLMSQRLGSDFKMTNKACYGCGSFEHLHYVCDKKVESPMWNNSRRVNHKNFSNKLTHSHPKRSFVPQTILTRSGKLSTATVAVNAIRPVNTANTKAVNTVRPVNTANTKAVNTVRPVNTTNTKEVNTIRLVNIVASKQIMNHPRTKTNVFKRGYSQSSRPFNIHFVNKNSIINTNVNTARLKHTTARDRAVGNPQQKEYKEKGVIDSGCSRHMTENKCYLDEYEDYNGGFVSFGDGKGRISGKGKIKTGSLDFDDVYFYKELKYNLFRGLTCLIAKAIIDESNTWHRRLGHINLKAMNKIVKGNLVKGLPSKIFENDHLCVACQKGKQYKASYKTKLNSIAEKKNRTLIEAARTMLVDSKLPTTFWVEAVNTA
ncbi:ribonuclease H-like domain-containing protein [Tanacetum coccineum]